MKDHEGLKKEFFKYNDIDTDLVQSLESKKTAKQQLSIKNDPIFKDSINYYSQLSDNINKNITEILTNDSTKKRESKPTRIKIKYVLEQLFYEKHDLANTKLKPGYFLFLINLSLAELDEYLECSEWCLNEIEILENYLTENSNIITDK